MSHAAEQPTGLDAAQRDLYAVPPEDFVQVRAELVARARKSGDKALATAIGALRKPTSAAAIVNRHVLDDPSVTERLVDIGDRLGAAQGAEDGIDRDLLRELSLERRTLVQQLSAQALAAFGPSSGPAIRDEVVATLDAAVADPDVAARLGRLVHAEQWSGFGAVSDAPALTVVTGGRSATKRSTKAAARNAKPEGGARRARELSAAERALSAAEADLSAAVDDEQQAADRITDLETRLSDLQSQLDAAGRAAKEARSAVRAARSRQREARSARDRAERRSRD